MKRSAKFEIRNPKSETPIGSQTLLSVLLRISNFGFRILTLELLFLASPALPATNIFSSADDLPKLRPPRAEMPPTFWEKYELWAILGSIVVLALIATMVWLLTRPKPPIIVPPGIRAKQALDLLLTRPEDGVVLSQVSQITRHYITEAFALPSGELTTAEFCRLIASHEGLGPELAGTISEFLRRCDERKFRPSPPSSPMAAVATAYKILESAEARLAELRRRAEQISTR
jgi:hypothetical protein